MDPNPLVDFQIDAGRRLIIQLVRDGFDVRAAFWAVTSEEDIWFLYIASSVVEERGLAEAYRALQASLQRLEGIPLSLSDVKLIGKANPMARDVLAALIRHPGTMATRFGGKQLGNVTIREAYIYPSYLYTVQQSRPMTSEEVLRELVRLMNRGPGLVPPSKVTLRDGNSFQGVPFSIQSGGAPGRMIVQFIAQAEFAPRVLTIDEIASIE
jgi:hypothetical protein